MSGSMFYFVCNTCILTVHRPQDAQELMGEILFICEEFNINLIIINQFVTLFYIKDLIIKELFHVFME